MNAKERLEIYKQALEYYKAVNPAHAYGMCVVFKDRGAKMEDLPEIMAQKPGMFWFQPTDGHAGMFVTRRINIIQNAITKLKSIMDATKDSYEIPFADRMEAYLKALEYYQAPLHGTSMIKHGFCSYFKRDGGTIEDYPEIMALKPAGISDKQYWFPYSTRHEFARVRAEILKKIISGMRLEYMLTEKGWQSSTPRKPEKDYEILRMDGADRKTWEIRSVKRLSDGRVFSVGDLHLGDIKNHVIESIHERDSGIWLGFSDCGEIRLKSAIKATRKPEKDYEILEYRTLVLTPAPIEEICKVKRLSDGEVFGVRDVTKEGTITGFEEYKGLLIVRLGELNKWIHDIQARKPILTSEDGVELFEGDKAFPIYNDENLTIVCEGPVNSGIDPIENWLYFSTREAAEDYRLNNAKVLSVIDVRRELGWQLPGLSGERKLVELVKSRLK